MKDKSIVVNINSNNYSFIIEGSNISKIKIIYPFNANITSELSECDDNYILNMKDCIACSHTGDKEDIISSVSFIPLDKIIRISIPNNYPLNLMINCENGKVSLKNIKANNSKIYCIRGNINVENSYIITNYIDSYESNIRLANTTGDSFDIHTITGNISVTNSIPDDTKLVTDIGNITLFVNKEFLSNTTFTIQSKKIKQKIEAFKEKEKTLKLIAPYGRIKTNIF